jgi:hypothetical protein
MYSAANQTRYIGMDKPGAPISVSRHQDFHLQNTPVAKSCGFKNCKYNSQSAGVRNTANSHCAVLAVWTGAESAERCIFHQDTSFGPRGKYCVLSHKLLVNVVVEIRRRKLTIGGLNPIYIYAVIPLGILPSALSYRDRSTTAIV